MIEILSEKPVKLLILLLTSVLITTASAAVYYSNMMQPFVTVSGATIALAQGNDWPSGSTLGTNATWVSLALKAYPNATLTYEQFLNVSNTDSASHTFRLRHVSITPASGQPQVGNFTFINFIVMNAIGVPQASFSYTTTGTTWNTPSSTPYLTLPGNTQWIINVETKAAAGANSDIVSDIQIAVDVQE